MTSEERSKLRREILQLSWPIILQNLMQTLMVYVDIFMLGRVGKLALASVAIVGPVMWALVSIMMALSVGTIATIARATGEKDKRKQEQEAVTSLAAAVVVGILSAVVALLLLPYLVGFFEVADQPQASVLAKQYLMVNAFAIPFLLVELVASAILRGAGDTRTPMYVAIFANVLNVIGDYVLIFGKFGFPELGVVGAGVATAVSYFVEGVILFFFLFTARSAIRIRIRSFALVSYESAKRLFNVAIYAAVEPLVAHAGFLLYVKIVTTLGEVSLAAHRTAMSIESIAYMPFGGFAIACSTMIGQALGAGRPQDAEFSFKESARLITWLSLVPALLFLFIPQTLVWIFVPNEPEVIRLGGLCLAIVALELPFMALSQVYTGALRGAGDTKSIFYVNSLGIWLVRVPLSYILGIYFGMGLQGVWIMMIVDWAVRMFIFAIIYKRGKWKEIKL